MTARTPGVWPTRGRAPAFLTLLVVLGAPRGASTQASPRHRCDVCHGELEFLRQHVATLPDAVRLFAPAATLLASAHSVQDCADCHDGFGKYPHRSGTTRPCASCHEEEQVAIRSGVHGENGPGECMSCHGVHSVPSTASMKAPRGIAAMNAACATCHPTSQLREEGPHSAEVLCASCHRAHSTRNVDMPSSAVSVPNQPETCGACHEEEAASSSGDAHGSLNVDLSTRPPLEKPGCTGCHGGHGMVRVEDPAFAPGVRSRCSRCHVRYAESFADSYHGQASALGSGAVATCQDCHGAHSVFPASDPRSWVSAGRLLETCRACHPDASPGFEAFQPHADPHDPDRYPRVFWAYWLMNGLLLSVFAFFGAHTLLWVGRLALDAYRGSAHAHTDREG